MILYYRECTYRKTKGTKAMKINSVIMIFTCLFLASCGDAEKEYKISEKFKIEMKKSKNLAQIMGCGMMSAVLFTDPGHAALESKEKMDAFVKDLMSGKLKNSKPAIVKIGDDKITWGTSGKVSKIENGKIKGMKKGMELTFFQDSNESKIVMKDTKYTCDFYLEEVK